MNRRPSEKYEKGSYTSAEVIKCLCPDVIKSLFVWLEDRVGATEKITIEHWYESYFHIFIVDTRMSGVEAMRAGFSIDIKNGILAFQLNPPRSVIFARTSRWKHEIVKYFGPEVKNIANFYQDIYSSKEAQNVK